MENQPTRTGRDSHDEKPYRSTSGFSTDLLLPDFLPAHLFAPGAGVWRLCQHDRLPGGRTGLHRLCAVFWGLLRRCGASGLPELFHRQGRAFAAFCELAVLLVLTGSALSTVMNASGFLTSAVYPGAGAQITAAAAMLVCAYGAYSGIEAVSAWHAGGGGVCSGPR